MENKIHRDMEFDCDCPNCDNEFIQFVNENEFVFCPACNYTFSDVDIKDFTRVV